MIVGEAPGGNEDEQGKPFVGQAGKMLNNLLEDAGLKREQIYVTNTVKCRPVLMRGKFVSNRAPEEAEVTACKYWLWKELELIKPKVVVTLGKIPTKLLLGINIKTFKLLDYLCHPFTPFYAEYTKIIPCWHPAYLMRSNATRYNQAVDCLQFAKKVINNENQPPKLPSWTLWPRNCRSTLAVRKSVEEYEAENSRFPIAGLKKH
jgi:DNA polymerase